MRRQRSQLTPGRFSPRWVARRFADRGPALCIWSARIVLVGLTSTAYLLNGLGLTDGVVPGVAVGLALGVAVGIAVGAGDGVVGFGVAPVAGVAAGRIPEEIPGAAGRNPSGLASVDPVLFGAGPAVEGALAELPAP
jgi:hypothetical protein